MSNEDTIKDETLNNEEPQTQESAPAAEPQAEPQEESKHERRRRRDRHSDNSEKLQELGAKLAEEHDRYVRSVAEFENYRKRTNIEKADLIVNGGKKVIESILPVVDDMERALQAMADDNAREGVQLIYNKLMGILAQKGLKPMNAKGEKFTEELHEAVTQIPAADESQKGLVADEVLKGYYLNDKVLRYAKVVVAI